MHASSGSRVLAVETYAVRSVSSGTPATEGKAEVKTPVQVLRATCYISAPPTAFVFTGQGSAAKGMGMDLYATSAVARRVWDTAEAHLNKVIHCTGIDVFSFLILIYAFYFHKMYGFSILQIIRENPLSLTVHFGGRRGAAVRRNYMALEVEAPDGSGPIRLLPDITDDSPSYTFVHPTGLLFATQFTQPALVLVEKAAFDDMRYHGLIPRHALFAGHSLGEYAALSSVVELLSVSSLVSLVFLRGMVMQGKLWSVESAFYCCCYYAQMIPRLFFLTLLYRRCPSRRTWPK